jgi:hypothetical protein
MVGLRETDSIGYRDAGPVRAIFMHTTEWLQKQKHVQTKRTDSLTD